jgi:hypothetical protein
VDAMDGKLVWMIRRPRTAGQVIRARNAHVVLAFGLLKSGDEERQSIYAAAVAAANWHICPQRALPAHNRKIVELPLDSLEAIEKTRLELDD